MFIYGMVKMTSQRALQFAWIDRLRNMSEHVYNHVLMSRVRLAHIHDACC